MSGGKSSGLSWAIVLGLGVLVAIVAALSFSTGLDKQLLASKVRKSDKGACYIASTSACSVTTLSGCEKKAKPPKYGYYWDKGKSCIKSTNGIGVLARLESGTGLDGASLFRRLRTDCFANLRERLANFDGCPRGTKPTIIKGPLTNYIFNRDNSYEPPDSSNSLLSVFYLIPDLTIEGETGCSALVECVRPGGSPSPSPVRR